MKPEVKPFRYCAQVLNSGNFVIREAIRFDANSEDFIIYALYYDDWIESVIREPIYLATDEQDLRNTLATIAQFYSTNPEGMLDFISKE